MIRAKRICAARYPAQMPGVHWCGSGWRWLRRQGGVARRRCSAGRSPPCTASRGIIGLGLSWGQWPAGRVWRSAGLCFGEWALCTVTFNPSSRKLRRFLTRVTSAGWLSGSCNQGLRQTGRSGRRPLLPIRFASSRNARAFSHRRDTESCRPAASASSALRSALAYAVAAAWVRTAITCANWSLFGRLSRSGCSCVAFACPSNYLPN